MSFNFIFFTVTVKPTGRPPVASVSLSLRLFDGSTPAWSRQVSSQKNHVTGGPFAARPVSASNRNIA